MATQVIRVGIIGCGKIAQVRHIPEYLANPNAEIVGYYDWNESRAQEMADKFGGKVYKDVESLLANPEIDAVSVCVANAMHADVAIKALEAGKHVLGEKPMATSLEECIAMVEAAKKAGKELMIDQNQRLAPAHVKARELILQGLIGTVLSFKTTFGHGGPETWSVAGGPNTWFFDKNLSKFGAVFDLGIHKIDVIQYILNDRIKTVTAKLATLDKRNSEGELIAVDDNAMGIYTTEHGVLGSVTASWTYYGEEDNTTYIYGNKGIMKIYANKQYALEVILRTGEKIHYEIGEIQTNDNQTKSGIIDEFINVLLEKRPSLCDADSVLHSMKVTFASIESSETNREICL